ncbi:hypothetical protein [Stygiolobus caldivivus]|nr:hypothetical protein [Stygiolobus caldivivus]
MIGTKLVSVFLMFPLLFVAFPFLPHLAYSLSPSFTPGDFLLYNQTVTSVFPNGTVYHIYEFYLQQVVKVFPNGSMLVNTTIYDENTSSYLPPVMSIDNASHPKVFMYISPSLLGKVAIYRDGSDLIYNGTEDGLYVYYDAYALQGVKFIYIIWVNKTGVICRFQTLQIGAGGGLVGNTTAVLWLSNLYNKGVVIPKFLSTYTKANVVTYSVSNFLVLAQEKLLEVYKYIIFIGVFLIVLILLFRK